MKPITFSVWASRTFNHPWEKFANFSFSIEETYSGDVDREAAQRYIENAADIHKARILADLRLRQDKEECLMNIKRIRWNRDKLPDAQARKAKMEEISARIAADPDQAVSDEVRPALIAFEVLDFTSTAATLNTLRYKIRLTAEAIQKAEEELATLPQLEAELAAMPAPWFTTVEQLQKAIHPGHPDHPETAGYDEDY